SLRFAGQGFHPYHQRGQGCQSRRLRHQFQASRNHRMGVISIQHTFPPLHAMKHSFLCTFLLLGIVSLAAQASMESVETTVAKAREYLGGDAKLNAIHSLQYRGTVILHQGKDAEGNDREPLVGNAILSFQKPSSQKIEFHFPEQSLVTGFNGYEGY